MKKKISENKSDDENKWTLNVESMSRSCHTHILTYIFHSLLFSLLIRITLIWFRREIVLRKSRQFCTSWRSWSPNNFVLGLLRTLQCRIHFMRIWLIWRILSEPRLFQFIDNLTAINNYFAAELTHCTIYSNEILLTATGRLLWKVTVNVIIDSAWNWK